MNGGGSFLKIVLLYLLFCELILVGIGNTVENKYDEYIGKDNEEVPKQRTKRVVWMKNRKLVLPPGSILTLTPQLQIPFLRQPPEGLNSDIKLSWVFYMFFDKLGFTDETNPFQYPFFSSAFYPFTDLFRILLRRQWNGNKDSGNKSRRSVNVMSLPSPDSLPGGERAILIPQLEQVLDTLGIDGRPCLLRAVCEIHVAPLHRQGFGLFGEILTLVFSISRSYYAESHLGQYLKAENAGKSGDCGEFMKNCGKSMFVWVEGNKYSKDMQNVQHPHDNNIHSEDEENEISEEFRALPSDRKSVTM